MTLETSPPGGGTAPEAALLEATAPAAPAAPSTTTRFLAALGTRGAVLVLGALAGVLLARALQPELRGQYYLIVTIATTSYVVAHFSLERSQLQQYVAGIPVPTLTANGVLVGTLLGVVAAGVAVALVTMTGGAATRHPMALMLGLAAVPAAAIVVNLSSLLVLIGRTSAVNRSRLLAAGSQCLLLLVLALTGHASVFSVLVVWLGSNLLSVVLLMWAADYSPRRMDVRTAARAVLLGSGYHVGTCALYLLWRIDVLLLADRVTPTALGLYSLAVTLTEMTATVGDAVAQAGTTRQLAGDLRSGADATVQLIRLALLGSALLVTLVVALSPVVVPLLYGAAYAGVVPALAALAPGVVFLSASRAVASYLVRFEAPLRMSLPPLTALVLNVILNLVLIGRWGIVGSGAASSVAYAVLAGLQAAWLCRETHIGPRDLLPRPDDVMRFVRRLRSR